MVTVFVKRNIRYVTAFRATRLLALAVLAGAGAQSLGSTAVQAQAVVTAVNGNPITTFDVDEHVKVLRLFKKSAGQREALDDLIADRLKYDEARHWGIDASDSDMTAAMTRLAGEAKMQPQAVLETATRAHVDVEAIRAHLRSIASWNAYVKVRNKTLGVSDEEINAELAKQAGTLRITDYTLRQVIFVVPAKSAPLVVEARIRDAQALRNRFDSCDTGLQLARGLPDVAIKETMTRTSDALSASVRTLLADTPKGHLTTPERTAAGIEMIAVCDKSDTNDQTTLRDRVQNELLVTKLASASQKMYQDLRAKAVIGKN